MPEEIVKKKPLSQKIIVLFSVISFGGSTIFSIGGMFVKGFQKPEIATSQETTSITDQLKVQESGYQKVLEREPNNPVALQGLAEIRLQMNNPNGAVEPLEKLSKLNPQDESLKTLLTKVKQQVNSQGIK
jgi:Tetratricopeptide repeat